MSTWYVYLFIFHLPHQNRISTYAGSLFIMFLATSSTSRPVPTAYTLDAQFEKKTKKKVTKITFLEQLLSACLYGLCNNQIVKFLKHAFLLFCHFAVTHPLVYNAVPVLLLFIYQNLFTQQGSNHGPSFRKSCVVISGCGVPHFWWPAVHFNCIHPW